MSCDLRLQIPVGVLELRPAAWRGLAGPGSTTPWRWGIGAVPVEGFKGKINRGVYRSSWVTALLATGQFLCGPQGKDGVGTKELAIIRARALGVWDFVARWGRISASRMPPTSFVSAKLLDRRQSPARLVTEMIRSGMAVRER